MRRSVHDLTGVVPEDTVPKKCPACGSIKLRKKVSSIAGLRTISDGDIITCADCKWTRKYRNLPKEYEHYKD